MRMAECHPEEKHHCKGLCKKCYNRLVNTRRGNRSEYQAEYRKNNPEKFKKYYDTRRACPVKKERDALTCKYSAIKQKYGLTKEGYAALLEQQDSRCAICDTAFAELSARQVNVDHCHKTGAIRGLLCTGCNTGLGLLGDSAEGLRKALDYLEK